MTDNKKQILIRGIFSFLIQAIVLLAGVLVYIPEISSETEFFLIAICFVI